MTLICRGTNPKGFSEYLETTRQEMCGSEIRFKIYAVEYFTVYCICSCPEIRRPLVSLVLTALEARNDNIEMVDNANKSI